MNQSNFITIFLVTYQVLYFSSYFLLCGLTRNYTFNRTKRLTGHLKETILPKLIFTHPTVSYWTQHSVPSYYTLIQLTIKFTTVKYRVSFVFWSKSVFIDLYESYHNSWIRKKALAELLDHIKADDKFTDCISIGPVSTFALSCVLG